jgi:hypothetical protein
MQTYGRKIELKNGKQACSLATEFKISLTVNTIATPADHGPVCNDRGPYHWTTVAKTLATALSLPPNYYL